MRKKSEAPEVLSIMFACDGMRKKSEAPEVLSIMFACDGVPPAMIVDGGRELISRDSKKRVRDAGSEDRQTLPRFQWMNTAEGSKAPVDEHR
jgi:hypothetical protein